ncbi:hypothetical protein C8Q75DRAFT_315368 [Abortiporus biennis]|nr:hypothetical protein C8Q75DRAFT_315368 [Abortiporus biennis]
MWCSFSTTQPALILTQLYLSGVSCGFGLKIHDSWNDFYVRPLRHSLSSDAWMNQYKMAIVESNPSSSTTISISHICALHPSPCSSNNFKYLL